MAQKASQRFLTAAQWLEIKHTTMTLECPTVMPSCYAINPNE